MKKNWPKYLISLICCKLFSLTFQAKVSKNFISIYFNVSKKFLEIRRHNYPPCSDNFGSRAALSRIYQTYIIQKLCVKFYIISHQKIPAPKFNARALLNAASASLKSCAEIIVYAQNNYKLLASFWVAAAEFSLVSRPILRPLRYT